MDVNILKYMAFIKTVEYGSFTQAAQKLNYSQSAISRMINDLESEWNITLLERSRTGVKPTSDGAYLLPYAGRLCKEYENLQSQLDDLKGLQGGTIRIGTFSSVATHWLPNIIKSFQNDYPSIEYELIIGDYKEIERWIREGRVDCGFLKTPVPNGLETIPLLRDKFVAVLPEDHPLSKLKKVPVAALCTEPFMLLEKDENNDVYEMFRQNGLSPKVRFRTWDDYAIMSMVECGLGVSILPELILKRISYNIVVKELDIPMYRNIVLALRDRKSASVAAGRFLEYIDYRKA